METLKSGMNYRKIAPCKDLQSFVKWFFILEHNQYLPEPFEIKSTSTYSFAMVFNYGSPYQLFNDKCSGTYLPKNFLSGVSISPYKLRYHGKLSMIGIIFYDTAFQELFKIPPFSLWTDERMDLQHIIGGKASEINYKLAEAADTNERIDILETWLLDKIRKLQPEKKLEDYAVEMILQHKGMIKMDDLATKIGFSPRQLRRKFKDRVGISPKVYARLKRFAYVNHCLSRNLQLSWNSFINEGGFYDQSHLIKDYREFSRENPTIFIDRIRSMYQQLTTAPLPE